MPISEAAKTNVTLKINAEILREARILAAARGTSISSVLMECLRNEVTRSKEYERARASTAETLREEIGRAHV